MLNTFRKWLIRLISPSEQPGVYRPQERMIYHYWNGQKDISLDPLLQYRKIMEVGPELSTTYKVAVSQHSDNVKAMGDYIARLRELFEVKFLADGGLSDIEVVGLFDDFMTYCDSIKKKSNLIATTSEGTSGTTETSSPESPPTPNSSVSGSTASGPPTVKQEPLPSEPVSPLGS